MSRVRGLVQRETAGEIERDLHVHRLIGVVIDDCRERNRVANQEEANYLINYHASSDTFDKVDMRQLKKHVAEAAELTLALADTPEPVGSRLTRAQVEQTLHETHLDDQLKVFGIWQEWESGKRGRSQ